MKSSLKGRINTNDFLFLICSDQLLLYWYFIILFYKTTYLDEEVNHTEPSLSVRVPWIYINISWMPCLLAEDKE
jgi:hypothetical protein